MFRQIRPWQEQKWGILDRLSPVYVNVENERHIDLTNLHLQDGKPLLIVDLNHKDYRDPMNLSMFHQHYFPERQGVMLSAQSHLEKPLVGIAGHILRTRMNINPIPVVQPKEISAAREQKDKDRIRRLIDTQRGYDKNIMKSYEQSERPFSILMYPEGTRHRGENLSLMDVGRYTRESMLGDSVILPVWSFYYGDYRRNGINLGRDLEIHVASPILSADFPNGSIKKYLEQLQQDFHENHAKFMGSPLDT